MESKRSLLLCCSEACLWFNCAKSVEKPVKLVWCDVARASSFSLWSNAKASSFEVIVVTISLVEFSIWDILESR